MASFKDLKNDWSMLCQECTDCWTKSDLQLAAELGKNLLERNKELENHLKHQQNTIDEQTQEIEYMKKQTAALKEVNDSRLRVYEQLEVSIQDLERENHRLAVDNTGDKKQIKSQRLTIESLETNCEALQQKLDALNAEHETLLRRHQSNDSANLSKSQATATWTAKISRDGSIQQAAASPASPQSDKPTADGIRELAQTLASDDKVTELLKQLNEVRNQKLREQKRVSELEEQLNSILEENANLECQVNTWRRKADDMKNLEDEISALEEVRQGRLCGRCLRGVGIDTHDALSIMLDQEEYDDLSLIEPLMMKNQRDSETPLPQDSRRKSDDEDVTDNPYRVLVEKYEALLQVQRHPTTGRKMSEPEICLSLQDELVKSGDFNSFTTVHSDLDEQNQPKSSKMSYEPESRMKSGAGKKPCSGTPTDFSEAESSSSGFSDETSNKATQTDGRPGSFLCSIADGEDCRFSIYDDANPFESRFRKTPEYRHLFREIYAVLKRAAETKDEGEKLPQLDDLTPSGLLRVPPVTPAHEEAPSEMTDDTQSIISSVVSEPVYRRSITPTPSQKGSEAENTRRVPNPRSLSEKPNELPPRGLHTPKRPSLEYLSIGVNVRKKSSGKKNSAKKTSPQERPTTLDTSNGSKTPTGRTSANGRRKFRAFNYMEVTDGATGAVWNGNTMNFFPSKPRESCNPVVPPSRQSNSFARYVSEHHNATYEYKPSAASTEVARLKQLEMSYAEVLRLQTKSKTVTRRH